MKKILLGTDWWTDCDDCVALRILTRYVNKGEIKLVGVGINACMDKSVASLDAFLHHDGVSGVPIGIDLSATDETVTRLTYQFRMSEKAVEYKKNEDAEDGVRLYRRLLAQADEKITIVEIGFHNISGAVLESGADDISDKTGVELFKEKVEKVYVMGGAYDKNPGHEYNFFFYERTRKGAHILCEKCPVPMVFLGFEVGEPVLTGGLVLQDGDILKDAMTDFWTHYDCKLQGRSSWDPMTVLLAIIGDGEKAGYDLVYGKNYVDPETGDNTFSKDENGNHAYVVKKHPDSYYVNMINKIIV